MILNRLKHQVYKTLMLRYPKLGEYLSKSLTETKRIHVFCVGLPRSGTHSIANIFKPYFRAEHEPFAGVDINFLQSIHEHSINERKIKKYLLVKDRLLQIELESAHYLYNLIPYLVELFPSSKFILTVREPKSWLRSEMNMNVRMYKSSWSQLEKLRYGKYNYPYAFENIKKIPGVYPIRSYLDYYKRHIKTILENVPENRLLVLDTFTINDSIGKISNFVGLNSGNLNLKNSHSAKSKEKKIKPGQLIGNENLNKLLQEHIYEFINKNIPSLAAYCK